MAGYKLKSSPCMCCVLFRSGHPAQLPATGRADTEGLSVVAPHHCPQNHRGQALRVRPLVSLNSGYCSCRIFCDFVMSCLKVCSISLYACNQRIFLDFHCVISQPPQSPVHGECWSVLQQGQLATGGWPKVCQPTCTGNSFKLLSHYK